MGRVALPFYGWKLSSPRPKGAYPLELRHLGDHILKRRMDLGLTRKAAAAQLRANPDTVKHWERGNHLNVLPAQYPGIIAFLGYNPMPEPRSLGQAIRRERLSRGWALERLAREAGVDPASIRRSEEDIARPARRVSDAVRRCLSITSY